jgi:hypothetical protein
VARKKDNTIVWVLGAVAVAGYLYFKKNAALNTAAPVQSPAPLVAKELPSPSNPHDIAVETPGRDVIGIYLPSIDPTGNSLQLF